MNGCGHRSNGGRRRRAGRQSSSPCCCCVGGDRARRLAVPAAKPAPRPPATAHDAGTPQTAADRRRPRESDRRRSSRSPARRMLEQAATYVPKNNIVEIDISEYAGYGGLIVANGGLAPNPDSFFAKQYGFQVKLSVSRGGDLGQAQQRPASPPRPPRPTCWPCSAASSTSVVPVQIGFSRGADMVVVDQGVASINQLAGKVVAGSQFNESEFFLRYLAQEAGLQVKVLRDLDARPGADEVGMRLLRGRLRRLRRLRLRARRAASRGSAAASAGRRSTDEVIEASQGKAKMLVSNRNLLVIADILAVNKGFAQANPKMVRGHRARPARRQPPAARAAGRRISASSPRPSAGPRPRPATSSRTCISRTCPENLRVLHRHDRFRGLVLRHLSVVGAGLRQPDQESRPTPTRFMDTHAAQALAERGKYADQKIAIAPIRRPRRGALEGDPLLKQGHPLLLRAELRRARRQAKREPGVPRHDQAVPAGEPGLDGAAARPRRQRARRRSSASRAARSW